MLGHGWGHDPTQIVSWIVFDHALLYRMAHDFGQVLFYPPGNIMYAIILSSMVYDFNQLCQMAGFNLCDIHCANLKKDVALQTDENFIGVRV